jgi:hypothetical protein
MTEARNDQQDEHEDGPPYPTFNERKIQNNKAPIFSRAYQRLMWPIQGEFPSAISVMTENTPQPLFNPETGEWHEIASQSITNIKVSSLEASLENLDSWERQWERMHMEHADPAYDECEFVTDSDLDDDERDWDEDSDTGILVHCCGEDRPFDKKGLTLEVRPSPENGFVTVKDYIGGKYLHLYVSKRA